MVWQSFTQLSIDAALVRREHRPWRQRPLGWQRPDLRFAITRDAPRHCADERDQQHDQRNDPRQQRFHDRASLNAALRTALGRHLVAINGILTADVAQLTPEAGVPAASSLLAAGRVREELLAGDVASARNAVLDLVDGVEQAINQPRVPFEAVIEFRRVALDHGIHVRHQIVGG